MHWIQRHILKTLATAKSCRYIDLKPKDVEGNLFMYHLTALTRDGYVEKGDGGYHLTKKGKRFVGDMSLSAGSQTRIPRVFVMLFCENKRGELLLYKWNRQPYLDHVSLPFNRMRYGQSVFETAAEVVKHKTNLKGVPKYAGDVYVRVQRGDDEFATHYLAHIFTLRKFTGELFADGLTGQPFWGDIGDFKGPDLVYGAKEIASIIKNKKPPFFEEILVKKD